MLTLALYSTTGDSSWQVKKGSLMLSISSRLISKQLLNSVGLCIQYILYIHMLPLSTVQSMLLLNIHWLSLRRKCCLFIFDETKHSSSIHCTCTSCALSGQTSALVLMYLFTDLCGTVQLHNQLWSSLVIKEKIHDRRWRERQSGRKRKGKKERAKECGYVSRGKPQVGSGVAGLIRLFPLCDWVSH